MEKDTLSACGLLGVGAEFARASNSHYTRILFLLAKGMVCFEKIIIIKKKK